MAYRFVFGVYFWYSLLLVYLDDRIRVFNMQLNLKNTYEVVMFDYTATPYMYLQRWDRLEYHQRLNSPWNSVITFRLGWNDPYIDELLAIKDDHILFIYRIDPITKYKQRVYEGVHSTTTLQSTKSGQIMINLYSRIYCFVRRRSIIPPEDS
jgi:hypothetical protein